MTRRTQRNGQTGAAEAISIQLPAQLLDDLPQAAAYSSMIRRISSEREGLGFGAPTILSWSSPGVFIAQIGKDHLPHPS
jgi:hypothetical protein